MAPLCLSAAPAGAANSQTNAPSAAKPAVSAPPRSATVPAAAVAAPVPAPVPGQASAQASPSAPLPAAAATPPLTPAAAALAAVNATQAQSLAQVQALTAAALTLQQLQNQAQTTSDDSRLAAMAARAAAIESQTDQVITQRSNDLAVIAKALKPFAASRHHRQTSADRAQAAPLLAMQATLNGQLRQAQAVGSAADYTFNLIAERRREGFSARVLEQSASPLSPDFWSSLSDAASTDLSRLMSEAGQVASVGLQAPEPRAGLGVALGLIVAVLLVFPLRRWLERLGARKGAGAAAPGLARTAGAVWIVFVDTGLPALAAIVLHLAAQWGGLLSDKANDLASAGVVAVTWGSIILALGRALGTDPDPDRRLLGLPDKAANRVRPALWTMAVITGAGFLLTRLNYVAGASVAFTIAANCLLSLAYAGVAGLILISLGRSRTPADADDTVLDEARAPVWTLLSLALSLAIIATVGAVLFGYTTLAALISSQIFWLSVLGAITYLLLRFIDDFCTALFRGRGWAARTFSALFNLRTATINQTGVLASAFLQLLVIICALSLALTPFGQSGNLLLAHLGQLGRAIHIGSATISPTAIAAGLATLVVGTALAHLVQGWFDRRYLPVTGWDAGLRNSVSTGVGYLGVGIALVCAFAAMGLGFSQIALIASALSVGIGFGLQQVVQNFVSGVILLIERPVKVGDWVNVGGVEGDIRRIRVRATEIQTFDRSTVIVPNSDLITKAVQNKTLGDPRGRIELQIPIAKSTDARRTADLIKALADGKAQILKEPEPAVYIDSVVAGGVTNLNCYLYVASPRDAYRIRSELYFEILEAFEKNSVAI